MSKSSKETIVQNHAWLIILVGVVMVFAALYFNEGLSPVNILPVQATSAKVETIWYQSHYFHTLLALVESLGIAFIGFGLFGILVDTKNWREYFAERLKEVVLEQKFLDRLDPDALRNLQTNVMKAFFGDEAIDKEGSFLNYFQTNLHRFISEPYREDVTAEIVLKDASDELLTIYDRVTYTCRKARGTIQKQASWRPDKDECKDVCSLKIAVKFPYYHDRKGEEEVLFESTDGTFEGENLKDVGVTQSLERFKEIDQLAIIVESIYTIESYRFQYWQMAHPTKNFMFVITYPKDYVIQLKPLVLEPENVMVSLTSDMSATVKCDSWMLPQSGLAWRFRKK